MPINRIMSALPACADVLPAVPAAPADSTAGSEPAQACTRLVRELGGRLAAASAMASAVRLLSQRSVCSAQERMQLLSLRSETSQLLTSLEALLVDAHEPAANALSKPRPLSSLHVLFEKLSTSLSAQVEFPSGFALQLRESPMIQLQANEAIIEQILLHLVRSSQPRPDGPVGIDAYLDSHQAGGSDLCFEVDSGFSWSACAERELECAGALALSINAELTSGEYARAGDAMVLKLRIPVVGFTGGKKSLRLLLVDDRRINQLVLADELGACGHVVAIAGSAPEALDLLGHQAFDAVLTDLNMPGMNGLELARAIRASRTPASKLPVVLLVPDESPAILEKAQIAGVTAIARKHAGPENILATLAGHVPASESHWDYMRGGEWGSTVH